MCNFPDIRKEREECENIITSGRFNVISVFFDLKIQLCIPVQHFRFRISYKRDFTAHNGIVLMVIIFYNVAGKMVINVPILKKEIEKNAKD